MKQQASESEVGSSESVEKKLAEEAEWHNLRSCDNDRAPKLEHPQECKLKREDKDVESGGDAETRACDGGSMTGKRCKGNEGKDERQNEGSNGSASEENRDGDGEDESEEEEEEEDDDDDEDVEAAMEPEVLMQEGLDLLKSRENLEEACHKLSWALENKLRSVDQDEMHPALGIYYLNYGHALQTKEEMSNELFSFEKSGRGGGEPSAPGPVAAAGSESEFRENVTDEQLAWENLEMARLVMTKQLQNLKKAPGRVAGKEACGSSDDAQSAAPVEPTTGSADPALAASQSGKISDFDQTDAKKLVEDLSFVHVLLGDIGVLEERFDEAAEEFQSAISLREAHGFAYVKVEALYISLAQAKYFGLHPEEAKMHFETARKLIQDHLAGVGGFSLQDDPKKSEDYQLTLQDIDLQLEEIKKGIADGTFEKAREERAAAADSNAAKTGGDVSSSSSASSSSVAAPGAKITASACRPAAALYGQNFEKESVSSTNFERPQLAAVAVVDMGVVSNVRENSGGDAEQPVRKRRRIAVKQTPSGEGAEP